MESAPERTHRHRRRLAFVILGTHQQKAGLMEPAEHEDSHAAILPPNVMSPLQAQLLILPVP